MDQTHACVFDEILGSSGELSRTDNRAAGITWDPAAYFEAVGSVLVQVEGRPAAEKMLRLLPREYNRAATRDFDGFTQPLGRQKDTEAQGRQPGSDCRTVSTGQE